MGSVEIVRDLYSHWERGDFKPRHFFDPEVEFSRRGASLGVLAGEWRGVDQVWEAMADYIRAFDRIVMTADRFIELEGDRVLVLDRHTARGRTSSAAVEHELASLFTLRNGKVVRLVGYWDRAEAMRAAGLEA